MSDSVRLAKQLAQQLSCSRREAELYIEGGWVSVDGSTIEEPGYRVQPDQALVLSPEARVEDIPSVSLFFHKPAGLRLDGTPEQLFALFTADSRLPGERSGLRFLKKHLVGQTLVTPLAAAAGGLVVFTQEYSIKRKLLEDSAQLEQEYVAEVVGQVNEGAFDALKKGLLLAGKVLPPIKASWQNETHLRFALKGLDDTLIPRLCTAIGVKLVSIKRIRIGGLAMAKLPQGMWRYRLGYERF